MSKPKLPKEFAKLRDDLLASATEERMIESLDLIFRDPETVKAFTLGCLSMVYFLHNGGGIRDSKRWAKCAQDVLVAYYLKPTRKR